MLSERLAYSLKLELDMISLSFCISFSKDIRGFAYIISVVSKLLGILSMRANS